MAAVAAPGTGDAAPPFTPYTYIQCPCSDTQSTDPTTASGPGHAAGDDEQDDEDDDRTFDPRAPRSNYSLYPLEYLLYCEDCHQIRCPRCIAEEIVTYFCPNCQFEVPTSNIKSEGNRCTRSCFQCPVCIGPLSVTSLEAPPNPNLLAADNASHHHASSGGPYVLSCLYCHWSSTEIGIKFDKPNGIFTQLTKIRNGGRPRLTPRERKDRRKDTLSSPLGAPILSEDDVPPPSSASGGLAPVAEEAVPAAPTESKAKSNGDDNDLDIETQFANLKTFYQNQLSETSAAGANGLSVLGDLGFSSPGSLSRIMSLYTGGGLHDKKSKSRAGTMREALDPDEGLRLADLDADDAAIERLREGGWHATAPRALQEAQVPNVCEPDLHGAGRFLDELRPVPYLLRTKRSKRCPVCRHIISKPEPKVASTRFRIRLVAGSYIPKMSIRPLNPPSTSTSTSTTQQQTDPHLLAPLKPVQYLLTFKNPIFEPVKVTLATPATTPGRFASKVTVLCPQFEIDANTDVWDEALKEGDRAGGDGSRSRRRRDEEGGGQHQAEAGKIWERGRNWVSIVVEVVPSPLRQDTLALMRDQGREDEVDTSPLREDEDVLEIPMFVRIEWEADPTHDDVGLAAGKDKDAKEKRELAYWSVLGIGRISQD